MTPKRGRPRLLERNSLVSTWVRSEHHEQLRRIATKKDVSVSALVRDILAKVLPKEVR